MTVGRPGRDLAASGPFQGSMTARGSRSFVSGNLDPRLSMHSAAQAEAEALYILLGDTVGGGGGT